MPFSVDWLIEHEIILMRYRDVVTADELFVALTTVKQMIDTSPRLLVHVITDVGDITESAPLADSIRIVRSLGTHPRSGWNITLREKSMVIKMGISLGRSLLKVRARTFDTLGDALAHLKQFDGQLTWDRLDQNIIAALPSVLRPGHSAESKR